MDLADVVVTRGGSNTIFELLAMAKLHIIVPLGREASRDDQIENADYFVKKGYAIKLEEQQLTIEGLEASVEQVLRDKDRYYQAMKNSQEIKSVEDFYTVLKNDMNKGKK